MTRDNTIFTDDRIIIQNFISYRSKTMYEYIKKNNDNGYFTMWYKYLTHSDLTTRGKRTSSNEGFEKNLLYYLSLDDMNKLKIQFPNKRFESAKQSNIGMPDNFYNDIGIPRIKRRNGKQRVQHNHIKLNDYMDVYLVNDSLKYFDIRITEKIMNKLGKEIPNKWKKNRPHLEDKDIFTKIDLHQAIHGLGVEADSIFHALRLNMFLNDSIIFIVEHNKNRIKLYILLEKNTMFYSVMNIYNEQWVREERIRRYKENMIIKEGLTMQIEENLYNNEWDNVLLP